MAPPPNAVLEPTLDTRPDTRSGERHDARHEARPDPRQDDHSEPAAFDLNEVVSALRQARARWRDAQRRPREPGGRELPSPDTLAQVVDELLGVLFPMRLGPPDLRPEGEDFYVGQTLDTALHQLQSLVRLELQHEARQHGQDPAPVPARAQRLVQDFARSLPAIRSLLDSDVVAAFRGDPAARSMDEVLLCYPGIRAMIHHRLAHQLHRLGAPLLARMAGELAHARTGIDIHPGAQIGPGCFIDHGTGVVIGETARIGANVRLYQAVTLGAKSFPTDEQGQLRKGLPRHPTVEDEVVIYAGATILGPVTIGRGSVIGGNVWLTRSVPPGSHISQASHRDDRPTADTQPGELR